MASSKEKLIPVPTPTVGAIVVLLPTLGFIAGVIYLIASRF